MSRDLALHNSACNSVNKEYQECLKQYPIGKYFGNCDKLHKKLTNCIKEQLKQTKSKYSCLRELFNERRIQNLPKVGCKDVIHRILQIKKNNKIINIMEPFCKKLKTINNPNDEVNIIESYNGEKSGTQFGSNLQFDNHEQVTTEKTMDESLTNEEENSFVFPPDDDISDMLEGIEYNGSLPTITERYFSTYYKINVQKPEDDMCIRIHSNRICMISIAPSHTIFQDDKKILKVDYKVSDKLDRMLNKVSGKSKHGAQPLQSNSNICAISCSDGQTYMIKCCIIGKLIEVNELLLQNPELLKEPPHKGGYLALVLPNLKLLDKMKETLLTPEKYKEFILSRTEIN